MIKIVIVMSFCVVGTFLRAESAKNHLKIGKEAAFKGTREIALVVSTQ